MYRVPTEVVWKVREGTLKLALLGVGSLYHPCIIPSISTSEENDRGSPKAHDGQIAYLHALAVSNSPPHFAEGKDVSGV